ncbi:MAG: FtsH protease activity modulator HflK [Desulfobacterales bacterium]|nr:FtsH protease activity modulator HflK [Desulfobacterales bacterium]
MTWDWEKLREQQQKKNGGPIPPQFDEIVGTMKNIKFPGGYVFAVFILLAVMAYSSIYTIEADEVGVIQRFGKYLRTTQPGLNFKLPLGIETVRKVRVKHVFKEEFGYRTTKSADNRLSRENTDLVVSSMLTGDLNVAIVPWIVQYRIKDPYNYLFKVRDAHQLLTDMSEAAMRLVVGDRSINEVITKREEIAVEAKRILQNDMDNAEIGIHVKTIEMKKTNVPEPVQPSFNEVNQSIQEKEKMIYKAREEYNKAIPAAMGEADRTIKTAEGYALDRINRAGGDVSRFTAVYTEYIKAKDVTKRRLYLEMVKELFPKIGPKYIVDGKQKTVLPLLNIGGTTPIQMDGTEK